MKSKEAGELLAEASAVIEKLLDLSTRLLGVYGYGISNDTHDEAMAILGDMDSYRARIRSDLDRLERDGVQGTRSASDS